MTADEFPVLAISTVPPHRVTGLLFSFVACCSPSWVSDDSPQWKDFQDFPRASRDTYCSLFRTHPVASIIILSPGTRKKPDT